MGQQNTPGGNPNPVNRTLLAIFIIVGIIQVILLSLGYNYPFQIINLVLTLVGIFFTIPQSIAPQFPGIRSVINRIPRTVNIAVPVMLFFLLLISLAANLLFLSHNGITSGPSNSNITPTPHVNASSTITIAPSITPTATPTPTATATAIITPTICPYLKRMDYANNLRNIPMNVTVPQGCYMLVSIYNGYYNAPDQIDIPAGSLLAFQGPITISAFLSGGGGGFAGFSNEASAKSFYCYALHSGNTYGITKTPHSLHWAPTC